MKIIDIAQHLGISSQMAYRHIARDKPTNSLDTAKEWRSKNLDIIQTKSWRIDGNPGLRFGVHIQRKIR